MEYFNQVTPPQNVIDAQNTMNVFAQLLQKIEKRAMDVVNEKYPYMIDLVGNNPIIIDPYANYSPDDTKIWMEIFTIVHDNRELYSRLFFIRGGGTRLIRNQQWGFILQPIISPDGWESIEQYNHEKQCLNDYKDDVVQLLKIISNMNFN